MSRGTALYLVKIVCTIFLGILVSGIFLFPPKFLYANNSTIPTFTSQGSH